MMAMDLNAAKQFVLKKLRGELSEDLIYHSVEHTLDVTEAVRRLGEMEGLQNVQITLLETAALFHDLGFTEIYDGHEEVSVRFAREALPRFGYSQADIEVIVGLIRATKLPQNPQNHLEEVLADADLDYIGRDDMFIIGQCLYNEWIRYEKIDSLREWNEKQMRFLKAHYYFTRSANTLRKVKKQENIRELEKVLHTTN